MRKRKFLIVSSLILSSMITTSLSSCGFGDSPNIVDEKKFSIKLNYEESKGAVYTDLTSGTLVESTKVKISIYPNEGYETSSIKVNGVDHVIEKSFYFTPVEGENIVSVEFSLLNEEPTQDTYTVKTLVTQGGVVTPSKESGYVGETVSFEVVPDEGYELVELKINDLSQDLSLRQFTPIKGENTIQATFSLIEVEPEVETYTVVVESSIGGEVVLSKTSGNVGETVTFSVTPDEGYELESLIINDLVKELDTREFKPVKGVNIVKAIFKEIEVIPDKETYSIVVDVTSGGKLTPSQTSGYVGEVVSFIITPDDGYEVSELYINNTKVDNALRQFEPIEGENTIRCVFTKIEEPVKLFTIKVIESQNGTVSVDKTSGNVGETIHLTITPDTGYQLSELFINGESVSLTTSEFTPIMGENTIKGTFEKIRVIDKGLEYTGIANNLTTNFTNVDEFANTLYEGLSSIDVDDFKTQSFKDNLVKFLNDIDAYNSILKRYGFDKNSIKSILNSSQFRDFVSLFNAKLVFSKENVAKIVNLITYFANNYSLEYSCGVIGLLGLYFGIFAITDTNSLINEKELTLLDDAINTFNEDNDISSYANTLKNNSTINILDKAKEFLSVSDVIVEFMYKIISSVTTLYGANDNLINNIYNFISILGLGDKGNSFSATQEEYVELFNFIYKTIDNCFFSKKSFIQMIDILANLNDPFDTLTSIYSTKNNFSQIVAFNNVFKLLNQNAEKSYYFIKLVGKVASKLNNETLNDIFTILGDISLSNESKIAKVVVKVSKIINSSFTMLYPYESLVKDYLKDSTEFISSLLSIIKVGFVAQNDELITIDTKEFVSNLEKFATYDETRLTSEEINEVYSYYDKIYKSITQEFNVNRDYKITINTTYKVGDTLDYNVTLNGKDVTSSFEVKNFDSSYIHYGKLTLVSNEGINYYFNYIVTNSGNNLVPYKETIAISSSDNLESSIYFYKYDNKGNKEIIYLKDLVHSVINTDLDGIGLAYVKYGNDYFFFKYKVLNS